MQKKAPVTITKCLFPSANGNWTGIPDPKIEGYQQITTSVVKIDGKDHEQFEFIPEHLNLCNGGNAKRIGNEIHYL